MSVDEFEIDARVVLYHETADFMDFLKSEMGEEFYELLEKF